MMFTKGTRCTVSVGEQKSTIHPNYSKLSKDIMALFWIDTKLQQEPRTWSVFVATFLDSIAIQGLPFLGTALQSEATRLSQDSLIC